jgi:hypothetical protein
MMEALNTSKALLSFYETVWCNVTEDSHLLMGNFEDELCEWTCPHLFYTGPKYIFTALTLTLKDYQNDIHYTNGRNQFQSLSAKRLFVYSAAVPSLKCVFTAHSSP